MNGVTGRMGTNQHLIRSIVAIIRQGGVQVSDRMQRGHISLPNGLGLDFPGADGNRVVAGVGPNELTRSEDRERIAGIPWHKSTPARLEPL